MGNSCSGDKSRTTYLDSNSDGEDSAPTKPLHAGSVRDLSFICGNEFRPDHIISCSDDNSILSSSVNSLLTGVDAAHYNFVGHRKGINKLSAMNRHVWSASRDLSVKQWDLSSGSCVQTLSDCHELNIAALDTHAGGSQVATGSRDYSVKLWDAETAVCLRELTARRNVVTCLAYAGRLAGSPSVLYQGGEDLCIKVWDTRAATGAGGGASPSAVMGGFVYFPTSLCVNPSSEHVLVSGCKGFNGSGAEVKCWDARQPAKPLVEFLGHTHDVTSCAYVHIEGRPVEGFADCVVSCSKDGSIAVWNLSTKEKVAFSSGLNKHFTSIAVIPVYEAARFGRPGINAAFSFAISAYDGSVSFCSVVKSSPQQATGGGGDVRLTYSIITDYSTANYVCSVSEDDIINSS